MNKPINNEPIKEVRSPQLEYYYRNKKVITEKLAKYRELKRQQKEYQLYKKLHKKYGSE